MKIIFPSLYEELDMLRYTRLAADVLSKKDVMVALCDDSGQIVWANKNEKRAKLIVNCNKKQQADLPCDEYSCQQTEDGVNVVYCNLGELSGGQAGHLVFYDVGNSEDMSQ